MNNIINELSTEEISRYSRQILLPEIGIEGQKKLKASNVLIVGAGGLGSPACLYLAAAGIGKIGIIDFDNVDETNLHRQILFTTSDIGTAKAEAAGERIKNLNPNVIVYCYTEHLTKSNALNIIAYYDIVIDCTDNAETRYIINESCFLSGKPFIYGSIFRFEGQVSVFDAISGPCYRCLFPAAQNNFIPNCIESGVIGALPGIIGSLQAMETIKIITGHKSSLAGKLLLIDALNMNFTKLSVTKNPNCKTCSGNQSINNLKKNDDIGKEYLYAEESADSSKNITVKELRERLENGDDIFLLDVREKYEFDIFNLSGYLIPLNSLPGRMSELDPQKEIVVYCQTGERSATASEYLRKAGFKKVKNLTGGIVEWENKINI